MCMPRPLLLMLLHDHQVGCAQHVLYVGVQLLAELQSHQDPALLLCFGAVGHVPHAIAAPPVHLKAWLALARRTCT